MTTGINYGGLTDEYLLRYQSRYNPTYANYAANAQQGAVVNAAAKEQFASSYQGAGLFENKCTDGQNDGKISGFSKFLNACEGVLGMGVNMVKEAIKHPFKTALMIGLCCIPVVGPAIGGAMACYGIYKGVSSVAQAAEASKYATTDAEAKACWENIGGGVGATALSVVALKGSASVLKHQLTGGSTTVTAVKAAKAGGASKGDLVRTAVSEGVKETATNIGTVAQAGVQKVSKAWQKGKQYWQAGKDGTLAQTLSDDVANLSSRAGNWAKSKYENLTNKNKPQAIDDLPDGPFDADGNLTSTTKDGTTIKWHKDKTGKITATADDGTVTVYNNKGRMVSRKTVDSSNAAANGNTVKTEYANGKTVTENVKYNADGTKTTTVTTTNKGNTTVKSTTVNSDGKVVSSSSTSSNGITVEVDKSGKSTVTNTYNENGTGIIKTKGETIYMKDGVVIENPTTAQKAEIISQTSNTSIKINQALDNPFEFMGVEISDEMLMMLGILENSQE